MLGDHGTSVAGLIAAAANNGVGGRGVAPAARLRGFNFLTSSAQETIVLNALGMSKENPRSDDVHVFNMSYGSVGSAENLTVDARELFRVGVTRLREGRGALYVKAAGNEFNDCTELDADRQPVAPRLDLSAELGCVAANRDGENQPALRYRGRRLQRRRQTLELLVGRRHPVGGGPGGGRWQAPTGHDHPPTRWAPTAVMGCTAGPWAATEQPTRWVITPASSTAPRPPPPTRPALSRCCCRRSPDLTWRDVKHILAKTARRLDADIPRVRVAFGGTPAVLQHGWITNAAGYPFHNWYGFGAIDVDAAAALAAIHTPDSLGVFTQSAPVRLAAAVTIPDHDGGGLTQTQNVTGLSRTANIEAVQLRLEVTHANPRELGVELTSPAGNPKYHQSGVQRCPGRCRQPPRLDDPQ